MNFPAVLFTGEKGFFNGKFVKGVGNVLNPIEHQRARFWVDLYVGGGIWDLFDTHDDLHDETSLTLLLTSADPCLGALINHPARR
jgi:hypothetical protein